MTEAEMDDKAARIGEALKSSLEGMIYNLNIDRHEPSLIAHCNALRRALAEIKSLQKHSDFLESAHSAQQAELDMYRAIEAYRKAKEAANEN